MRLDRRTFLQQAGVGLVTLLISQVGDKKFLSPYLKTLAQPTRRKLALLVGINQYPNGNNLNGCVTDTEMQRELLIYRYGFQPQDILCLTDSQATKKNIHTAFLEHLKMQAQASDVVIFHFSGYGSTLKLPQSLDKPTDFVRDIPKEESFRDRLSLIPRDGIVKTSDELYRNDLLLDELLLMMGSLSTDNYTIILDTSYSLEAQLPQSNLKVRSYSDNSKIGLSETEISLKQPKPGQLKGIVLQAATAQQNAAEGLFSGFSAGLFTYGLTQYLWEVTPASTINVALNKAAQKVERVMGLAQQPTWISSQKQSLLTYYLAPEAIAAQGIIVSTDNGNVEMELLGLPALVLANYGVNSCLKANLSPQTLVQIRSKDGFKAKGRVIGQNTITLQPGEPLQELYRIFPRNLGLTVALDGNLERIERVDATSAFSGLKTVSGVGTLGDSVADCVFGFVDKNNNQGGYGLFAAGGVIYPNSKGIANEAIKSAVKRLTPQLQTLLAAKLWRLLNNQGSSGIKIKLSLELIDASSKKIKVIHSESTGEQEALETLLPVQRSLEVLPTVTLGSQIQYRLENNSDEPLYFMFLSLEPDYKVASLFCPEKENQRSKIIQPGESVVFPSGEEGVNWIVSGTKGIVEINVICQKSPFEKANEVMANPEELKPEKEQIIKVTNSVKLVRAICEDLHNSSEVPLEIIGTPNDVYAFDVNKWASINFIYQVG